MPSYLKITIFVGIETMPYFFVSPAPNTAKWVKEWMAISTWIIVQKDSCISFDWY